MVETANHRPLHQPLMTTPTLHLHHSDDVDALLDDLAEIMRVPLGDPFTPEVIVVPTVGVRDHVTAGLGERLGIAANIEFEFPARFVSRVLASDADESDPWALENLTWSVFVVLVSGRIDVPGFGAQSNLWTLARRIADLFDSYANQRPEIIRAWADGIDSDGTHLPDGLPRSLHAYDRWQGEFWREVRNLIGVESLPERVIDLLADLSSGLRDPKLPERVFVFGVGGLSPTLLRVLVALSSRREVHVHLRHPSSTAWQSTEAALAGALNSRESLDLVASVANPLLASWGRPSLEAAALLNGHPAIVDHPIARRTPFPETLLGRLQADIAADRRPTTTPLDESIRVHACHGPTRQVEVLRDALAHAFVDDPSLRPHEVLVLCPDVPTFAPLVESMFSRGELPIPIRIGDRSLVDVEPLVEVVQSVFDLVVGRASASEVLSLVQLGPVRARFGWSAADVEALGQWFSDLGVRWGLDGAHRVEWSVPAEISVGTWRDTVDQLLAGVACAAPTRRAVVGDTPVHDAVSGDDLPRLGGLADFLQSLLQLHDEINGPRTVEEWVDIVHRVLDGFCSVPPGEEWRLSVLHREIQSILDSCLGSAADPSTTVLTSADLRALLGREFAGRPGSIPFRSGSVTMTSLVPEAGVPARVVCLLGFDEAMQTNGTFDGDDLLGFNPCIGERHARNESRRLLLDALMSARDRVLITCTGADVTTNDRVPFVVPLTELLDVLEAMTGSTEGLVVRHPRHGFDEKALTPGGLLVGSLSPFTFDRALLDAALARRRRDDDEIRVDDWTLPPSTSVPVSFESMAEAMSNPTKAFLRGRLDVRLPESDAEFDDGIPIALNGLALAGFGSELLQVRSTGGDAGSWMDAARLDADVPPGELGVAQLGLVSGMVDQILATADAWSVDPDSCLDVEFEVRLGEVGDETVVPCRFAGVDVDGGVVVDVAFRRLRQRHRLVAALKLACLVMWRPDVEWRSVTIGRGKDAASKADAFGLVVSTDPDERRRTALRFLEMAVGLRRWSEHDAVPLFDKTSRDLARGALSDAVSSWTSEFEYDQWGSLVWGGLDFEDLVGLDVRASDPSAASDDTAEGDIGSRAEATALWVWGAFDSAFVESTRPPGSSIDDADEVTE